MIMESSDLIMTSLAGIGGAGGGCGIGYYILRRVLDRQDKLEKKVKELEEEKLAEVRSDLKEHIKADKSDVTSNILSRIEGSVNKLSDKIDRFSEISSRQQAEIVANSNFINNLDKSFQRHKELSHAN